MISMRYSQLEEYTSPALWMNVCQRNTYRRRLFYVLSIDGNVASRITFNRGAEWSKLKAISCVSIRACVQV